MSSTQTNLNRSGESGGKARTFRDYLRPVQSERVRGRVHREFRARLAAAGMGPWPMTDARRAILRDAIFAVEDEMESMAGGRSDHPTVVALRMVRQRLADELGWK